jgi:hypothetical protein
MKGGLRWPLFSLEFQPGTSILRAPPEQVSASAKGGTNLAPEPIAMPPCPLRKGA